MRLVSYACFCFSSYVSIHAPWEGCDASCPLRFPQLKRFQFTHPGKGATAVRRSVTAFCSCFNSRTLGRVRLLVNPFRLLAYQFQFTHPGKGATRLRSFIVLSTIVSIHAPWEGCDPLWCRCPLWSWCFNSRTLGRVRPHSLIHSCNLVSVSIHAPWEGCDSSSASSSSPSARFQFTHPGKGATLPCASLVKYFPVSIHAPWEGCDRSSPREFFALYRFNSRTLGRVRPNSGLPAP